MNQLLNKITTISSLIHTEVLHRQNVSQQFDKFAHIYKVVSKVHTTLKIIHLIWVICFMSPQISSFSVTPNYEIIFFSSEYVEVINILDFLDGQVTLSEVKNKLESFEEGGESHNLRYCWKHFFIRGLSFVLLGVCLCFDLKRRRLEQTWTWPLLHSWSEWLL